MSATSTTAAAAFLPFHRALIEEEEMNAVLEVMRTGWLTTGPRAKEFEAKFGEYVGATHAIAVNSCTAALHLALAAAGVGEGDEVILPTMTFAASGETVLFLNAKPVIVDVAPNSFHIDPEQIERAITPRTKVIMPVHYSGYPCDMDAIMAIARKHKLMVIEDAAHAVPTRYKGKLVGSIGDITCFSFYATKTLTTGEGGLITTENKELADRMRILSLHGISRDAWKRYTAEGSWRYEILEMGYKYNLTDVAAAIGLAQLAKVERMRDHRQAMADRYTDFLETTEQFRPPYHAREAGHAWHLYVIQVNPSALSIGRDQVIEELKQRGIGTSVHFIPLHTHPLYQSMGYKMGQLPNAEARFENALSLPLHPGMTEQESDRVIEALRDVATKFAR